ncbi:pyocin knob domain-containing protein [Crenobacter cavernae]|uniref:Phage tail protein n=1 Tax=Crenobacter cavernae TaxID=2290923 RepID=A0A345Y6Q9_9NEIS|nr:pyocin knob domain-containing protein [Crenobacter cavernae]AXK39611.1 hypothetical protein DWG20_09240 [Crenobacter cavernae]
MRRISTPTAVADMFGPGKPGFRDGDPLAGILATRLNADFFNQIQEELAGLVEATGVALDSNNRAQVRTAILALIAANAAAIEHAHAWVQLTGKPTTLSGFGITDAIRNTKAVDISGTDLNTFFQTGFYDGANLENAPTGYSAVTCHLQVQLHSDPAAGGSNFCLQRITPLGETGLPNIPYVRRHVSSTTWEAWVPESSSVPAGTRSGLQVSYTGTSGVVTVTANALTLQNAGGQSLTLTGWNQQATSGNASGAVNSLDAGNWAFGTNYYLFAIYNPSTRTRGLLWSTSPTAPTLPAGFTYFCLVSANRTQSATNYWLLGGVQNDRKFQPKVAAGSNVTAPILAASGSAGSTSAPTYVSVSLSSIVPPNACAVDVTITNGSGTASQAIIVAPNGGYGPQASTTNPSPLALGASGSAYATSASKAIQLESLALYWASSASTAYLWINGWEINL